MARLSPVLLAAWPAFVMGLHSLQTDHTGLTFVHIPRNAGTAIEKVSLGQGIHWGMNMDYPGCTNFFGCSIWHVPPSWMKRGCGRAYKERDTFCVTRHPFERAVSEYRSIVKLPAYAPHCFSIALAEGCSAKGMNSCLEALISAYKVGLRAVKDCHMLPQSHFVWDFEDTASEREQTCHHILRAEDLPVAFNDLMAEKKIPVRLGTKKVNKGQCQDLSVNDLNHVVRGLLEEVYHQDFDLLNYSASELPKRRTEELEFFLEEDSPDEPSKKTEEDAPF